MVIEIYLDDGDGVSFQEAANWAASNCPSYLNVSVTDISDFSYVADEIAVYKFTNSADAAMFTLRWKGH